MPDSFTTERPPSPASPAWSNDTPKSSTDVDPPVMAPKAADEQEGQDDTFLEDINLDTTPVMLQKERLEGAGEAVGAREAETGEGSTAYSAAEGAEAAVTPSHSAPPPSATTAALPPPSASPAPAARLASSSSAPTMQRSGSQQSAKVRTALYRLYTTLAKPSKRTGPRRAARFVRPCPWAHY